MDVWDWVLLGIGSFVAITALVRIMLRRQTQLLDELNTQVENEQRRAEQEAQSQDAASSERNAARN